MDNETPRCERDPSHGPTWLRVASRLFNLGNRTFQSARCSLLSADDGSQLGSPVMGAAWGADRNLASMGKPERRTLATSEQHAWCQSHYVLEELRQVARVAASARFSHLAGHLMARHRVTILCRLGPRVMACAGAMSLPAVRMPSTPPRAIGPTSGLTARFATAPVRTGPR